MHTYPVVLDGPRNRTNNDSCNFDRLVFVARPAARLVRRG